MEHADKAPDGPQHRESAAKRAPGPLATPALVDNSAQGISLRALTQMMNHSPQVEAQHALNARISGSPYVVAQRKQLESLFGNTAQRSAAPEEELLQAKFETVQRAEPEEEELLQGKFAPVQRAGPEEEELLQGKFAPVQRAEPEEEELIQGKFDTVQRAEPEEEELLQGKFEAVQRAEPEEEELLQGKFALVQRAEPDRERRANDTGLPDSLKTGIEALSGVSLDNVKVHYNSAQPAQLNALAYAQGSDIHLAPGQERHLPHEAWHVVQQAQGRVQPTMQMKGGVAVNDDAGLEHEADVMGAKALQMPNHSDQEQESTGARLPALQRMTARVMRDEGRAPTGLEIANATASGIANSQRLAGHGRRRHGKQVEIPADVQAQQAAADRQAAIDQAIQLKAHQDSHSAGPVAQQASIRAVLSSPTVVAQRGQFEGLVHAAQLRSSPANVSYRPGRLLTLQRAAGNGAVARLFAGPQVQQVQCCIDPEGIGTDAPTHDKRMDELEKYFDEMIEKMDQRGYEFLQSEEETDAVKSEKWYALSIAFEAEKAQFEEARRFLKDEESANATFEAIKNVLLEMNKAYGELKKGSLSSETAKNLTKTSENREKEKEVGENNPIIRGTTLPSQVPELKGKRSPKKGVKSDLRDLCDVMIGLKGRLLNDDISAHTEWFVLYNDLVDYLLNLYETDKESYLGLIQAGAIEAVRSAPSKLDRGEMCNEEVPTEIKNALK